jgi:hypothetical protein
MTIPQRLKLVMVLAGVFYLAVIASGLGGFSMGLWAVATLLFFLWHLLLHNGSQGPAWVFVVAMHGAIAAVCLWIGHGFGVLTGITPGPEVPIGVAAVALGLARWVNISPEQAADLEAALERERAARGEGPARSVPQTDDPVGAVLSELARLPPTGASPEALAPLVDRLAGAGPAASVLERLERTDSRHLPYLQAHAELALRPEIAREVLDGDAPARALQRVLASGRSPLIVRATQDASMLLQLLPEAVETLPEPQALRAHAARLEQRDSDAADALHALGDRLAAVRDG